MVGVASGMDVIVDVNTLQPRGRSVFVVVDFVIVDVGF